MKKTLFIFAAILILTGCKSYKKISYVTDAGTNVVYGDTAIVGIPDPILKIGDLLTITVNSNTPDAAAPFNLPIVPSGEAMKQYSLGANLSAGGGGLQNYLVDTNGDIVFPIVGKIHVAGLSKSDLSDMIKTKIYPVYITEEPMILIRYANYKVSLLGEVTRPNVYNIQNENINIFEALAMAGDLTIYGRRDNVLLIRENMDGKRQTIRLDLRDARLINSPYFYLQQNDVLYIQPNNPKARSSALSTAETLSVSVVGILISVTSLLVNILR